jgi:hypothetical protein
MKFFLSSLVWPLVPTHCRCRGLLLHLITHSDTQKHSVGLLWTSDQLVAETSIWQQTTLTRDTYPCPQRDSNPQSQQASARRSWSSNVCNFPYHSLNFSLLGPSRQLYNWGHIEALHTADSDGTRPWRQTRTVNWWPCLSGNGQSPASRRGDPGSILGQSMWNL